MAAEHNDTLMNKPCSFIFKHALETLFGNLDRIYIQALIIACSFCTPAVNTCSIPGASAAGKWSSQ